MKSAVSGIVLFGLVALAIADWPPFMGRGGSGNGFSYDEGRQELERLLSDINVQQIPVGRVEQIALRGEGDLTAVLPDISEYPLVVAPPVSVGDVVVEIFATTHLSRTGANGLHAEVAEAFNQSDQRLADGRRAKVRIRRIASGIAYQFIAARRYIPDAFNPVHHLWAAMAGEQGIPMTPIRSETVRSLGGAGAFWVTHRRWQSSGRALST